jgi:molybdopterin-guanine dinucleotide biosynthesis protein A
MVTDRTIENDYPPTPGVLLAGGLARRMGGGDKPMRLIAGRPILERVIDRLAPQCDGLVLNANGDPARFAAFGLPVVSDDIADFPGPLAGVLAGLEWVAANRPGVQYVLTVAADCPFLPRDLVSRLHQARRDNDAEIAVAESGGQMHPIIAIWNIDLRHAIRHALTVEDFRKAHAFVRRFRFAQASWPTTTLDPFFNANQAGDLAEATRLAALDGG